MGMSGDFEEAVTPFLVTDCASFHECPRGQFHFRIAPLQAQMMHIANHLLLTIHITSSTVFGSPSIIILSIMLSKAKQKEIEMLRELKEKKEAEQRAALKRLVEGE